MRISYCITTCNEYIELEKLLRFLKRNIREEDEVIIQLDSINATNEVHEVCNLFTGFNHKEELVDAITNSKYYQFPLNNDFATFKNELFKQATGDYIFFIDADEYPHESLISNLPELLKLNPEVEMFLVPRVNTVSNIGLSHIQKWGWNISKLDNFIEEKEFDLDNPQDLDEYNLLKQCNLIIEENKMGK
jgi:glycosyltransferase involved in cell wall biosynthesis